MNKLDYSTFNPGKYARQPLPPYRGDPAYYAEMVVKMEKIYNWSQYQQFLVDSGFALPEDSSRQRTVVADYPVVAVYGEKGSRKTEDFLGNAARCASRAVELNDQGESASVEWYPRGYECAEAVWNALVDQRGEGYVDYEVTKPREAEVDRMFQLRLAGLLAAGNLYRDGEVVSAPTCGRCGYIEKPFPFRYYGQYMPGFWGYQCTCDGSAQHVPMGLVTYHEQPVRVTYDYVIMAPEGGFPVTDAEKNVYLEAFESSGTKFVEIRGHTFDRVYRIIPHDEYVMLENDEWMKRERRSS